MNSKHRCDWCGYVYDPALGCPERGVPPGVAFADLPADWCCPDCRAPARDFRPLGEAEAA